MTRARVLLLELLRPQDPDPAPELGPRRDLVARLGVAPLPAPLLELLPRRRSRPRDRRGALHGLGRRLDDARRRRRYRGHGLGRREHVADAVVATVTAH